LEYGIYSVSHDYQVFYPLSGVCNNPYCTPEACGAIILTVLQRPGAIILTVLQRPGAIILTVLQRLEGILT
jgi:hypothetical protein